VKGVVMKFIFSFIIIPIVLIPIFFFSYSNEARPSIEAKRSIPLACCCNDKDPRDPNWHCQVFTILCYENGIIVDKTISWGCCYKYWEANGWNPPLGVQCLACKDNPY
jgi:hypothetical protein